MATTLHLTNNIVGISDPTVTSLNFNHLQFKRGSATGSVTVNVNPQLTSSIAATFITKPLKSFRLTSRIQFSIRAVQSVSTVNATLSTRHARWSRLSGLQGWSSTSVISNTAIGTTDSSIAASLLTPAAIQFNDGDALAIQVVVIPVASPGFGTGSVTISWGSPTGNPGNSFFQFTDDFEEKYRLISCY